MTRWGAVAACMAGVGALWGTGGGAVSCKARVFDLLIVTALIGHWKSMGQLIQSKYKKSAL